MASLSKTSAARINAFYDELEKISNYKTVAEYTALKPIARRLATARPGRGSKAARRAKELGQTRGGADKPGASYVEEAMRINPELRGSIQESPRAAASILAETGVPGAMGAVKAFQKQNLATQRLANLAGEGKVTEEGFFRGMRNLMGKSDPLKNLPAASPARQSLTRLSGNTRKMFHPDPAVRDAVIPRMAAEYAPTVEKALKLPGAKRHLSA